MSRKNPMHRVRFVRALTLPRFNISEGFVWKVRAEKVTSEGFPIAGGWADADSYVIEELNQLVSKSK